MTFMYALLVSAVDNHHVRMVTTTIRSKVVKYVCIGLPHSTGA